MRFDKSLKVLNYAKDNLGFVELYTELDHSFVAGDRVFIVGGHYDNTNTLNYTTSYNILTPNEFNPFAPHANGYLIRSVNYSQNSFVIDVPSTAPLFYPFGVTNNILGDPQDLVNTAYNTYAGNDLYKSVYVSRTAFGNGRFRKGTVHNGVFGNDFHNVRINSYETSAYPVKEDVSITHIAAKNVILSRGIISSKTDSANPSTTKLSVLEDNTINPGPSPFTVQNEAVGANNDTWGYSSYEKFVVKEDSSIFNGEFNCPRPGFLEILNSSISRGKLGGKEPVDINGNVLTNGNLLSGFLGNYTNNLLVGISSFNGGVIDTFIDLKPTNMTWGANPGEIIFDVDYRVLANKKWTGAFTLSGCYVSGITPILPVTVPLTFNDNSDRFDITHSWANFIGSTYSFGIINSAQITLQFTNLVSNWAVWSTTYTPADFDFTKAKITFQQQDNIWISGDTLVSTAIQSYGNNVYFDSTGTTIVKEGFYLGMLYNAKTQFMGTSIGESIMLLNCKQMFQSDAQTNPIFNYTTIQYTSAPIKGDFTNCKIYGGTIHNSNFTDCFILETIMPLALYFAYSAYPDIFLYNAFINGNTRVNPSVKWDYVQYNGLSDVAVNNFPADAYILENGFFGERKTPWKTGPAAIAPLTFMTTSSVYNKLESVPSTLIYNSQTLVDYPNVFPLPFIPVRSLRYHAPSFENVQSPIDTTKFMSIIDNGGMYLNTYWYPDIAKKRSDVLFNGILDAPDFETAQLKQRMLDRTIYNTSGFTFNFAGVNPLIANPEDIREVDQNFEHEYTNYYNDFRDREQTDITLNVYDVPPPQVDFPDPAYPPNTMQYGQVVHVGPYTTYDWLPDGSTTALPDGQFVLAFRHFGPVEQQCIVLPGPVVFCFMGTTANVPACFIEIERVIVKSYNNLNELKDVVIYNSNWCPPVLPYLPFGDQYAFDLAVPGIGYQTQFAILDGTGNFIYFNKLSGDPMYDHVTVEVEFWHTWYFTIPSYLGTTDNLWYTGNFGGNRTKKTMTFHFNT